MDETVLIGAAAGFAGDRADAAGPLAAALSARHGARFLIFEMLAERTLALAQLEYRNDPKRGYSPALERLVAPALADCLEHGIRIVGNFGAANPRGAARRLLELARDRGMAPRIAVVEGDDLSAMLSRKELSARETGSGMLEGGGDLVAANLYLGAGAIAEAFDRGADIVITGRVADSALALGPLIHAFRWRMDDWDRLAAGTLAGHLLECGSQITGGYFADPPFKVVPGMASLGYPIAEIDRNGTILITKPAGTGGRIDRQTVVEQLLYEIHDPAAYLAPDVVLDVTGVSVDEIGRDAVRVSGARGKPPPETLKATVCIDSGYIGEAEISYAGPNAAARARLAAEVIHERMRRRAPDLAIRTDAIGVTSILNNGDGGLPDCGGCVPSDIRLRFATQSPDVAEVELLLDEVEALYCTGPAGGAGVRRRITPRLASTSCLIERRYAKPVIFMFGAEQ